MIKVRFRLIVLWFSLAILLSKIVSIAIYWVAISHISGDNQMYLVDDSKRFDVAFASKLTENIRKSIRLDRSTFNHAAFRTNGMALLYDDANTPFWLGTVAVGWPARWVVFADTIARGEMPDVRAGSLLRGGHAIKNVKWKPDLLKDPNFDDYCEVAILPAALAFNIIVISFGIISVIWGLHLVAGLLVFACRRRRFRASLSHS